MPLIRYFVFTGGALLALLYLADYYMGGPVSAAAETGPDLSIARIHSAQTWPEKIVFDTNVRQIPLTKTVASTSDAAAPAAPEGARQAFAMAAQPRRGAQGFGRQGRGAQAGQGGRSEQARRGAASSPPAVAHGGARSVLQRARRRRMVSGAP